MKKGIIILSIVLFTASSAFANAVFNEAIEKAATNVVANWMKGDFKNLKKTLGDLTRCEVWLLASGQPNEKHSYITGMPKSLNRNLESIAAYIFLTQRQRKGVSLWPKSFFSGKTFQYIEKGE